MSAYRIVVVDDELANLESLERILRRDGADVKTFQQPKQAVEFLKAESTDVLITDLRMSAISGMELLQTAKLIDPILEVVLITAYGTVELAVEAMRKGAYDFITKPLQKIQVLKTVHRALEKRKLASENLSLRDELKVHLKSHVDSLIGKSAAMKEVLEVASQAASSRANVLIEGESGTGKGVLAQYLHNHSQLSEGIFVKINCAAVPENLLEAELFGYEPGAFTGATKRKKGRVELAEKGTLFLDEIGLAPLSVQGKLLRFLQEGEFERLGSNETKKVDTRVVSASNSNLKAAIKSGVLREDLYYRLNVVHIQVPSLRARREDIPLLVQRFLQESAKKNARNVPLVHPLAMEALLYYEWPGNIRELQNLMERMVVLNRSGIIQVDDLPREVGGVNKNPSIMIPVGLSLKEVEKRVMDETLKWAKGDKRQAARLLGVHPRTIYRYLESVPPSDSSQER